MLAFGYKKGYKAWVQRKIPATRINTTIQTMASVKKRPGGVCWYARWMQNGKSKTQSTGVLIKQPGKTEKQTKIIAEQVAATMEQTALGTAPVNKMCDAVRKAADIHGMCGKIPTVREYFASYPRKASESREANRRRSFDLFLEFLGTGADRRIDLITPAICRDFAREQLKQVATATAKQYCACVSSAFRRAVEVDDYMLKNPMAGVSVAEEARAMFPDRADDRQERLPFTLEEIVHMARHFPEPWCNLVAVCWETGGWRLSDVCLLRWSSISWKAALHCPYGYIRYTEKKTRRARQIPLSEDLSRRLRDLLMNAEAGEEYVFPEMARYYLQGTNGHISTQFTALLRAVGWIEGSAGKLKGRRKAVSCKSFHSIRRAVVTYLRGGMTGQSLFSPDVCRDAVGHESEAVERGYFTSTMGARFDVMSTLADVLSSGAGAPPAPTPRPPMLPPASGAYGATA